jgi:uncharacterized membrane protein
VFWLCSETWLQAHYVAVLSGILYLILLNGLRWMNAWRPHNAIWLKLLRGTLAAVIVMFLVSLVVVPGDTFPPNWASHTGDIPGYQDITRIMEAKPGGSWSWSAIVAGMPGDIAGSTTVTIFQPSM